MATAEVQSPPSPGNTRGRGVLWGWLAAATVARGYLVFVLALAACALLPFVVGLTGSVIQSGSMQPHIDPGDVVLTMVLPEDAPLPLGRVITFEAPEGSGREGIVLHRLVAVAADGSLVTAGDGNAQPDSTPLAREDIIAQALILVPFIGLPSFWLTTGAVIPLVRMAPGHAARRARRGHRILDPPGPAPHRSDQDPRPPRAGLPALPAVVTRAAGVVRRAGRDRRTRHRAGATARPTPRFTAQTQVGRQLVDGRIRSGRQARLRTRPRPARRAERRSRRSPSSSCRMPAVSR